MSGWGIGFIAPSPPTLYDSPQYSNTQVDNILRTSNLISSNITLTTLNDLVTINPPITGSYSWTLPNSQGSNLQFLQNDGNGNLSWKFGVIGPTTSNINSIPRFNNTSGYLITDSSVTITNTDDIENARSISLLNSGSLRLKPASPTTSYNITFPATQGPSGSTFSNDGSGNLSWQSIPVIVGGSFYAGDIAGLPTGSLSCNGDITGCTKTNTSYGVVNNASIFNCTWTAIGKSPKSVSITAYTNRPGVSSTDNDMMIPLINSLSDGTCNFVIEETVTGTQQVGFYVTIFY